MSTVDSNDKSAMLELTEGEKMKRIFEHLRSAKFNIPTKFSTWVGTWPTLKRHESTPNVATICHQPAAAGNSEVYQQCLSAPTELPCRSLELFAVLKQNGPPSSPSDHDMSVPKDAGSNASLQDNGAVNSMDTPKGVNTSSCTSVQSAPELPATSPKVRETDEFGDCSAQSLWSSAPNIHITFGLVDHPERETECNDAKANEQELASDPINPKRRCSKWSRTKNSSSACFAAPFRVTAIFLLLFCSYS